LLQADRGGQIFHAGLFWIEAFGKIAVPEKTLRNYRARQLVEHTVSGYGGEVLAESGEARIVRYGRRFHAHSCEGRSGRLRPCGWRRKRHAAAIKPGTTATDLARGIGRSESVVTISKITPGLRADLPFSEMNALMGFPPFTHARTVRGTGRQFG